MTRDLKHTGAGILSMANRYRKCDDSGVLLIMLHCCKVHNSVMKSKMAGEDEEYLFNKIRIVFMANGKSEIRFNLCFLEKKSAHRWDKCKIIFTFDANAKLKSTIFSQFWKLNFSEKLRKASSKYTSTRVKWSFLPFAT